MAYFKNVNTLEELRKQYKELLKQYHPDNPQGSTEATQEINTEYDKLFKTLKDKHEHKQTNDNGTKTDFNNMKYDFAEDKILRNVLEKVIVLNDVIIEIIGNWCWISGNTYPHKDILKEIGFRYAPKKRSWYFHTEAFKKRSHKPLSMEDIRNLYGSTEVQTEQRKQLKQA